MSRADNKEKYKEYNHLYYIKHNRPKSKIGQAEQKISDLEAKLAQKDKEIKYYESEWKSCQIDLDHYKGECLTLQDEQNQKAIEQLEKVKEVVKHFCELHSDEFFGVKSQVMGIREDVFEFINQKINKLKGNVEDIKD